jgi:hypothetical protein
MKSPETRLLTQRLLESARRDRPSAEQKAHIWEKVALAPQLSLVGAVATTSSHPGPLVGAVTAKALGGAATTGLSAGKLLLAGVLAGSMLTAGVGVLLVRNMLVTHQGGAPSGNLANAALTEPRGAPEVARGANGDGTLPVVSDELDEPGSVGPATHRHAAGAPLLPSTHNAQPKGSVASTDPQGDDLLMREAALVSKVRAEIVGGRAAAALDLLDMIERESTHSLEPEELSLRVRALRLLGRDADADQVEQTLRARYPGHRLAR